MFNPIYAPLAQLVEQLTPNLLFVGRTRQITQYTTKMWYAVGPYFECASRIVVAHRLRKSSARVTPCFVAHRLRNQYSIDFVSLTGSGAPRIKHFFYFLYNFYLDIKN